MEDLIFQIQTYMEDNPHIVITDDMIKSFLEENMDKLVEEVKDNLIDGFVNGTE